jgi:hypothetical protein
MSPEWEKLIETMCPTVCCPPKKGYGFGGFSFGDGWINLITKAFIRIEALSLNQKKPKVYLAQAKEKFGQLNLYFSNSTSEMEDISREYEQQSYSVCEDCGDSGSTVNQHGKTNWIRTLCKDCRVINEKPRA